MASSPEVRPPLSVEDLAALAGGHADPVKILGRILPGVDWAGLGGVVHSCALHVREDGLLYNILVNDKCPTSLYDFLILNSERALASALVQGGGTLRAECGPSPELSSLFSASLVKWRAATVPASGDIGGVFTVVTSGKSALEPAWPMFRGGSGASLPVPAFRPVIVCPDEAVSTLRGPFEQGGAAAPPPFVPASALGAPADTGLTISAVLRFLHDVHSGSSATPAHGAVRDLLPPSVVEAGRRFIIIECGPTGTRGLYTEPPLREDGGVDPFTWVRSGRPLPPDECPVDWLFLSTFHGPVHEGAQGAAVVARSTLEGIFELVTAGAAYGDSNPGHPAGEAGLWRFHLYRSRRRGATGAA